MINFSDILFNAVTNKSSAVCVGLDPDWGMIPNHIMSKSLDKYGYGSPDLVASHAFLVFGKGIIDAIYDVVPIVKIQVACYERYGIPGMGAFRDTLVYAKNKGLLVIADVKRGDIGHTAELYSHAYLGPGDFSAHAVTVNPYFGEEGIKPFASLANRNNKGVFVICKTSNSKDTDIQHAPQDGRTNWAVYQEVGKMIEDIGSHNIGKYGYSYIGAVVAANSREEAVELREMMPKVPFLMPGYGAQGGSADDVAECFDPEGYGAIVNSSRDIIYNWRTGGYNEFMYQQAARDAVIRMAEDIRLGGPLGAV